MSLTGAAEGTVSWWVPRPGMGGEVEAEVEAEGERVAVEDAPYRLAAVLANWVTDSELLLLGRSDGHGHKRVFMHEGQS